MNDTIYDYVVVGGGISGLYAAYELKKKGSRVLLLEKSATVGGTWETHQYKGSFYELGPNTVLSNSANFFNLVNELGLEGELLSTPLAAARRYIFFKGKLLELSSSPLGLLAKKILSPLGFLRIFLEPLMNKVDDDVEESVAEFCRRKFGSELTNVLVKTFLKGVWAGDINKLSANIALKPLVDLEKEYGSVFLGAVAKIFSKIKSQRIEVQQQSPKIKKKVILSFKQGLQFFASKIAESLGDSVITAEELLSVERFDSLVENRAEYLLKTSSGRVLKSKSLVFACPAYVSAELIKGMAPALSRTLAEINYAPIALFAYTVKKDKFKKKLSGFGFLSADDDVKILGSIWASELFLERNLDDEYLLLSFVGGALNEDIIEKDSLEMWDDLVSEMNLIYKDYLISPLKKEELNLLKIKKINRAIPQLNLGHEAILKSIESSKELSDVYFVGNYLRGVSIKDALASAEIFVTNNCSS